MKERLKIVLSPKFYVLSSFLQTTKNKKLRTELGFTLIELSVVMAIVAMLLSFSLTAFTSVHDSQAAKLNREKIQMVQDAIEAYLEEYDHLPCVANRSLTPSDPDFGISFTTVSNGPCSDPLIPGVVKITPGVGDVVWIGHVPVRDLGIPENLAYDAYGNRFTYVVSEGLTDPATYDATNDSTIEVNNASGGPVNSSGTIGYTLISHGKSGAGAFKHRTGAAGKTCSTVAEDKENCDDDVNFIDIAQNKGIVVANFFDDKIVWKVKEAGAPPVTFSGFTGYKFQRNPSCSSCTLLTDDTLYDIGYPEPGNPGNIQTWYQGDNTHVTIPDGIDKIEIRMKGSHVGFNIPFQGGTGCVIKDGDGNKIGRRVFMTSDILLEYRLSTSVFDAAAFGIDRKISIACYNSERFTAEFRGIVCEGCRH